MEIKITMGAALVLLFVAACSGTSQSGVPAPSGSGSTTTPPGSGTGGKEGNKEKETTPTPSTCTTAGLWRESFERLEGDPSICQDIEASEFRPTGNINAEKRKCENECTCSNGVDPVACNAFIKETCTKEEDGTTTFDCAIAKVSDKKLSGTCTWDFESKTADMHVKCKYAIVYAWIAP